MIDGPTGACSVSESVRGNSRCLCEILGKEVPKGNPAKTQFKGVVRLVCLFGRFFVCLIGWLLGLRVRLGALGFKL